MCQLCFASSGLPVSVRESSSHVCICDAASQPTCLFDAYLRRDFARIESIVRVGGDVDVPTCLRRPLSQDVFYGCRDRAMFRLLKKLGADKDHLNCRGRTLLQLAANGLNRVGVEEALEWGHDINYEETNHDGSRGLAPTFECLVGAFQRRETDEEAIRFLRFLESHGANLKRRTGDGTTVLHLAAALVQLPVIDFLLYQRDFDINDRDHFDYTVLFHFFNGQFALAPDDPTYIRAFEARGATVKDSRVLHALCSTRLKNCILYCLEKGCDFEEKDHSGYTPLAFAAAGIDDDPEFVLWLVKRGVDVAGATSGADVNVVHRAARRGHEQIVRMFMRIGFEVVWRQKEKEKEERKKKGGRRRRGENDEGSTKDNTIPLPPECVCQFVLTVPTEENWKPEAAAHPLFMRYRPTYCGSLECGSLQTIPKSFVVCSKCKTDDSWNFVPRMYCSKECGKKDWKSRHKKEHQHSNIACVD